MRCVIQFCGSNSWVSNEPSIFWKHISLANTRNFISRREETVNWDVKCMTWCFFLQVFMITRWGQGLGRSWFFPHLLDVWNYRWGCSAWLWGPWFNAHELPTCLQSFFVPKYVWNPNQHDAFLKRKIKNIQNALPRCCCFLLVLQTNSAALSHHPMFKLFATKMSLIINHLIRWIKRHLHSGWQGCCPRKNAQICLGNLTVWPIRIIPEYVYSRISMCSLMKHWCWKWISVDYIADVSQVHIEDRRASFKPWIRREHEVGCRWCQISLTRKQTC